MAEHVASPFFVICAEGTKKCHEWIVSPSGLFLPSCFLHEVSPVSLPILGNLSMTDARVPSLCFVMRNRVCACVCAHACVHACLLTHQESCLHRPASPFPSVLGHVLPGHHIPLSGKILCFRVSLTFSQKAPIHNIQNVEAAQVSIDRRMDEQNVSYPYSEVSFSLQQA